MILCIGSLVLNLYTRNMLNIIDELCNPVICTFSLFIYTISVIYFFFSINTNCDKRYIFFITPINRLFQIVPFVIMPNLGNSLSDLSNL